MSKLSLTVTKPTLVVTNAAKSTVAGKSTAGAKPTASPKYAAADESEDQHSHSTVSASLEEVPKVELDKLYKTIELELRSNDPSVVSSYAKFATTAASHLDVPAQR